MLVATEENDNIISELEKNDFIWISLVDKPEQQLKVDKNQNGAQGDLVLCLFKKELHVMLVRKTSVLFDKARVIYVYPKYIFGKVTQKRASVVNKQNKINKIVSFEEIHHVDLLDSLDTGVQLHELRRLKQGWLNGKGEPLSAEGLDWLTQWFEDNYPSNLPPPHLYPTPEGEIQAEWSLGTTEVTLVIHLEDKRAWWHALDLDTDTDDEQQLELIEPEWARWLIEKISQLNGGEDA